MWSFPISMWRTMFSRTTMASSIRMPIESESPSRDMVFRVKPKAQMAMKLANAETGSARPVMTVERQELRKRNTTSTVSSAPSIRASWTLATARLTRSPASWTISSLTPAGMVLWRPATRARIWSLTWVVLYPLDLMISSPTA